MSMSRRSNDGFSPPVIYGLESYGFARRARRLTLSRYGRIELDGELPLTPLAAASHRPHPRLWHIIEGALQASGRAGTRQVKTST